MVSVALAIIAFSPLSFVGDIVTLFVGVNDSSIPPLVAHRVKKLALICVQAVYQKRQVQLHEAGFWILFFRLSCLWPHVKFLLLLLTGDLPSVYMCKLVCSKN